MIDGRDFASTWDEAMPQHCCVQILSAQLPQVPCKGLTRATAAIRVQMFPWSADIIQNLSDSTKSQAPKFRLQTTGPYRASFRIRKRG